MDSHIAIRIDNLSKQYRLGVIGTGTLSHDLKRWWTMNIRGKEDPYLKIGEVNDPSQKGKEEYVWALKDINLEIEKGDVVGIIGKNGAGKSTLLKILSRVTKPTTGKIFYKGRIASLLEVGTGFHPEMTGRENIYMNGAIMGMRKAEITRKLDEIVAFAGVERYIDTPVKRYSSGMTVRLGFSIAAHLEPDILVVDEVLAVGDAEFQKKAIGKMQDVSKGEGRTVLFVSHNMDSITRLCERCVLMENAHIRFDDTAEKVVNYYLESNCGAGSGRIFENINSNNDVLPVSLKVHDDNFVERDFFYLSEKVGITFEFEVLRDELKVIPGLKFHNKNEINIFDSHENIFENSVVKKKGKYSSTVWINENFFNEGIIIIDIALLQPDPFFVYFFEKQSVAFNMADKGENITRGDYAGTFPGIIRPSLEWKTIKE